MAKATSHYVCQSCAASYPKWGGRCEACGSWNSLVEEAISDGPPKGLNSGGGKSKNGKGNRIEFVPLSPALKVQFTSRCRFFVAALHAIKHDRKIKDFS